MEEGPQQPGHGLEDGNKVPAVHQSLLKKYYICSVCQVRTEDKETFMSHMVGKCKQICPDCKELRYIIEIADQKYYKCSGSCRLDGQLKVDETK